MFAAHSNIVGNCRLVDMSSPHRSIVGSEAAEPSAPIPQPVEPGGVVEHTSDLRPTQGAPDMDS